MAFPYLISAIAMMAFLGPGFFNLVWALALRGWVEFFRLARGDTLAQQTREYVDAARSLGLSGWQIMLNEILPKIAPSIIVLATLRVGFMIVLEASLSFLGVGILPSQTGLGLHDQRRTRGAVHCLVGEHPAGPHTDGPGAGHQHPRRRSPGSFGSQAQGADMSQAVLEIEDLQVEFPTKRGAIGRSTTSTCYESEKLGPVGESGSGKSITLLTLLRLTPHPGCITSGAIR